MRKWVQHYTQFERQYRAIQGDAAKLMRTNVELNRLAGRLSQSRDLPRPQVKPLADLVKRSAALNDALTVITR